MKKAHLLLYSALLLFCSSAAQATPSHDIMQKIAAESSAEISGDLPYTFSLPTSWTIHRHGKEKASFTVPYHAGVTGVIHAISSEMTPDEALKSVSNEFKSELSIFEQSPFETPHLSGTHTIASGRLGGEICKILIFSGKYGTDGHVLFYAIAPERWFDVYKMLFDDILKSIH